MACRPVSDPDVAVDGATTIEENSLVERVRRVTARDDGTVTSVVGPVLRPQARLAPLAGGVRFNRVLPIIAETLLLPASHGSHIIVVLAACVRPAPPADLPIFRVRPDPDCRRSRSVAHDSEPGLSDSHSSAGPSACYAQPDPSVCHCSA
jgi:hypothetical protein